MRFNQEKHHLICHVVGPQASGIVNVWLKVIGHLTSPKKTCKNQLVFFLFSALLYSNFLQQPNQSWKLKVGTKKLKKKKKPKSFICLRRLLLLRSHDL